MEPEEQELEAAADISDGIGWANGQPYPKKWPKLRKIKQLRDQGQYQDLLHAFSWPEVVREVMYQHMESMPTDEKPVGSLHQTLRVTSHWSGICTQSHGAQVLQAAKIVNCAFEHVAA